MKIVMTITIRGGGLSAGFKKEVESEILPTVGAQIDDPVWGDAREIRNLVINYEDNNCYIPFGLVEFPTREEFEMFRDGYEGHGWEEIGKEHS